MKKLDRIQRAVRRLRLKPGDVLVVDPSIVDVQSLLENRLGLSFPVAVVFAPKLALETVSLETLEAAVEMAKQAKDWRPPNAN